MSRCAPMCAPRRPPPTASPPASTSPSSRAPSPACWSPASRCSASSVYYWILTGALGLCAGDRDGHRRAGGARLRRLADLDLRPSRRRHLHQGRRCRRRSRRQGRSRHSRGRSAQPGHHRRQCRRQCRRLRRHGGRPVRDLCGDGRRHHGSRRRSSSPARPMLDSVDALSAGDLRRLHHHLDRRHLLRQARRQRLDHGRALQGPDRHRRCCRSSALASRPRSPSAGARSAPSTASTITGTEPVHLRPRRPARHRPDRRDHRILHRHRQAPGHLDRPGLGDRPRHQRHPGPRGLAGIDGAAGASSSSAASSRPTSSPACSAPASRSPPCSASPA